MRPHVEATWGWDEKEQEAIHVRWFRPAEMEILEVGQHPVGFLHVLRTDDEIRLLRIILRSRWQSRGIGASVLSDLEREAKQRAVPIRLQVLRVNERARAFYVRHGFRVEEETSTHFRMVTCDV